MPLAEIARSARSAAVAGLFDIQRLPIAEATWSGDATGASGTK
jgi:hypothetical protein